MRQHPGQRLFAKELCREFVLSALGVPEEWSLPRSKDNSMGDRKFMDNLYYLKVDFYTAFF
jgi:hypothetical protein